LYVDYGKFDILRSNFSFDVVATYAALECGGQNRRSNLKYSTFYKCTAGDLIYVRSNPIDIEAVNVVSNSPTSEYPNLFNFEDGTKLTNVYIAYNEHTDLGATITSGATFYRNNFAIERESYTPYLLMEHLSSYKCEIGTIFLPTQSHTPLTKAIHLTLFVVFRFMISV
jgi:hypothetical protein